MTNNKSVRIVIGILYNRTKKPTNPYIHSHFVGRILVVICSYTFILLFNKFFHFFYLTTNMTGGHYMTDSAQCFLTDKLHF